jgi:hypothetical protein
VGLANRSERCHEGRELEACKATDSAAIALRVRLWVRALFPSFCLDRLVGGTSVTMLERVYHHLLVSSAESARARLDAFASDQDKDRVEGGL